MDTATMHTVKEVAEMLGVTDARVRQLCIQHNIGKIVGNTRILNGTDVRMLKATRKGKSENGQSEENSSNED